MGSFGTTAGVPFAFTLAIAMTPSFAQTTADTPVATTLETATGSGAEVGVGGPSSVPAQVGQIEAAKKKPGLAWPTIPKLDKYGLLLAADYQALYQHATESLGEDTAAGGVARFYGQWMPFKRKRDSPNIAQLVFKVENRHNLGTDIAPQELASQIGYAGLTAVTFSDAGTLLTNLYWSETFDANRLAFVAGIVDVTDYVDVYALVNIWTDFNNYAFTTNPTIPAPNQGLGAAVRWRFTPHYYFFGGLADANGDPSDPGDALKSFFDVHEYFYHAEFGWIGSYENRFSDNAHITVWKVDDREAAGVGGGWGVALSFSRLLHDRWTPFVRAGYSDGGGAPYERLISAGVGYHLNKRDDFVGFGASWGRPPTESTSGEAKNQYTIEAYYRVQVLPHLQIVPDVQYIRDPAFNASVDSLWVPGLRVRATF